jgi:hypothetical protein
MRTGKDRIVWLSALLRQPFLEDCGDIRAQWRASHLSTFSKATDVSSYAELHVLSAK